MSLYRRGRFWWVDTYVGTPPKRVRVSTGTDDEVKARIVEQTIVAASRGVCGRQKAHDIIDAISPEAARTLNLEDAQAFYARAERQEGRVITERERRLRLNMIGSFAEWAREHTRLKTVGEVTQNAAWQFVSALREHGNITAKTINNKVGQLSVAWKVFMRQGVAAVNPWGIVRVQRDRSEERTGRAFTDAEVERILAECRRVGCEWEGVALASLYTGLRKRDCETLRWCDVQGGVVSIQPSKTKAHGIRVRIPIHPRLAEAIEAQRGKDATFVFPWRAAHGNTFMRTADDLPFTDILKAVGISGGEGEKVSFHSFRHTFVSRLAGLGIDTALRMRLAGHTDAKTHMVYTHDDENARRAIEALR